MIGRYILVGALAYLLGSIPFGYILVRLFHGEDVRASGSGNIGATNVARTSPALGLATLILDALKGLVAVVVSHWIVSPFPSRFIDIVYCSSWADFGCGWPPGTTFELYFPAALAALCAVVGHMFPVWLKFKGGKGVATGVGAFLALAPKAILIVLVLFAMIVALFRYVSLGSIVAAAAFPLVVWFYNVRPVHAPWTPFPRAALGLLVAASVLIVFKHHQNIRRLLAGTENRFTLKGKSA